MIDWLFIRLAFVIAGISPPEIVTISVSETTIYAGRSNKVEISVNVEDGYHIQANKVNDESLIPTTLEIKANEFITIHMQEFPPSKKFRLEGSDSSLLVFDGKFQIKLFVNPGKNVPKGKYVLTAKLRYQACDSSRCFFPRSIDFSIPVEVIANK